MSINTTYHYQFTKENQPKLSQISKYNNVCSYWIFRQELQNEFKRAVVNELSVFEPLKFYCTFLYELSKDVSACTSVSIN